MGKFKQAALKPHEQTFADLYRGGSDEVRGNATACYERLHPRAKTSTCEAAGSRTLNTPAVQEYLERKRRQAETEADVNQARVLRDLAAVGLMDIGTLFDENGNFLPLHEMDEQARRAIVSIEVTRQRVAGTGRNGEESEYEEVKKVRLADKCRGLEMLGRHLQMFTGNVNVTNDPLASLLEKIDGRSKGPPNAG